MRKCGGGEDMDFNDGGENEDFDDGDKDVDFNNDLEDILKKTNWCLSGDYAFSRKKCWSIR